MKRYFTSINNINNSSKTLVIDGDEFNHLKNVMRQKQGDKIVCFAGDGNDYECEITSFSKTHATCKILNVQKSQAVPTKDVTLFQGSLKLDKFELVLQKSAELGLRQIVPFESSFSVAKIKKEKHERYKKISQSASKQCGRADFLQVEPPATFKQMLAQLKNYDLVIFAYEKQQGFSLKSLDLQQFQNKKIALVVGSEGGFSQTEAHQLKALGSKTVTLGKRILRAETAAIALAAIVMFLLEEI